MKALSLMDERPDLQKRIQLILKSESGAASASATRTTRSTPENNERVTATVSPTAAVTTPTTQRTKGDFKVGDKCQVDYQSRRLFLDAVVKKILSANGMVVTIDDKTTDHNNMEYVILDRFDMDQVKRRNTPKTNNVK